jgi:hypothetical protein
MLIPVHREIFFTILKYSPFIYFSLQVTDDSRLQADIPSRSFCAISQPIMIFFLAGPYP